MDQLKLMQEITDAFGPAGFEDEVVAVMRRYTHKDAITHEDSLRNYYLRRPIDQGSDKPIVMLDAHSDEVGFIIQSIQPNGLMRFMPLGGWVNYTVPAHRVLVKNRKGELCPGIIASKPPHYLNLQERSAPLDISTMCIDVGACSAKEVDEIFDIGIGAPVSPDTKFEYNEKTDIMMAKAFDCRAGCACVLDVFNTLINEELDVQVVGALSTQEEGGIRGAVVTASSVQPDVAICFEGCPADDNFAESWAIQTGLKRGPMLRHIDAGMITNPRFIKFAIETAKTEGIQVQEAVRTGGSTNGAAIHLSNHGVPTIVIGVPVRYIHTHYGYATMKDAMQCAKLGIAILKNLNKQVIDSF